MYDDQNMEYFCLFQVFINFAKNQTDLVDDELRALVARNKQANPAQRQSLNVAGGQYLSDYTVYYLCLCLTYLYNNFYVFEYLFLKPKVCV